MQINLFHILLFSRARKIVFYDFIRFYLCQKVISPKTINPWSNRTYTEEERLLALEKAIQWLLYSLKSENVSAIGSYHIVNKWSFSKIETIGYLFPTFLNYGIFKKNDTIINKSILLIDRLLKSQKEINEWKTECIYPNDYIGLFKICQIISSLISVYKHTKDEKYLNSAIKESDWLCEIRTTDIFVSENDFNCNHTSYESYICLVLLSMYELTGNKKYKAKAIISIDWIINNKMQDKWFNDNNKTIDKNNKIVLHIVAFTINNLLDCSIICNDFKIKEKIIILADRLFDVFNKKKYLKGEYETNWSGSDNIIPLGCEQISIVWMKIFKLTRNVQYLNAALKINDLMIFIQDRKIKETQNTKGALPGSFPIWGKYKSFCFTNCATKYFADSLLLEIECLKEN